MKKDHSILLIQLDGNLASDVSTRFPEDGQSIWSKRRKLSSHQVESRELNNLSSRVVRMVTKVKGRLYFFCPQSSVVYLPDT